MTCTIAAYGTEELYTNAAGVGGVAEMAGILLVCTVSLIW